MKFDRLYLPAIYLIQANGNLFVDNICRFHSAFINIQIQKYNKNYTASIFFMFKIKYAGMYNKNYMMYTNECIYISVEK